MSYSFLLAALQGPGRGGPAGVAERKLTAVRTIASMASRWLRETDWDLDDARGLAPEDFDPDRAERGAISLSPELSNRLRTALSRVHPHLSPPDFVERLVAEKVVELESGAKGGPFGPKPAGDTQVEVERPVSMPPRSFFTTAPTVRSLWKKPPEEAASRDPRIPPGPKPPTTRF
jgi:hypothetical protein